MVREHVYRLKKWDKKVDPSIVLQRFTALKDISKEQLDPYLIQVVGVEKKVKEFLESKGVPTIFIAQYLAYAREILGKVFGSLSEETLRNEELAIRSKWVNRGLSDEYLKEISKMFGIEPKPLAIPVEVFKKINDFETAEDLNKVIITKPNGVEYELSSEKAYSGNKSIKFYGSLDLRHNPVSLKFDVDLYKYKTIGIKLCTDYGMGIQRLVKGYDANDNLLFEVGKDTEKQEAYFEILNYWIELGADKNGVENWDLAKKIEILIYGRFYGPFYVDCILGQIV